MIIYFDGGARPNPGLMSHAFVCDNGDEHYATTDHGTNNEAEYFAAFLAITYAQEQGFEDVVIRGDSMLVVMQVQGKWKVKKREFLPTIERIRAIASEIGATFEHVGRDDNPAGHLIESRYASGV